MMRIDLYLYENGYAESRQKAKVYIEKGFVTVDGRTVSKPSESVDETVTHNVTVNNAERYVGRGGYKLEHALNTFKIDATGKSCIDIGASTGGFTDCLLQCGAEHVCAVDSGRGQLHPRIAENVRVTSFEGLNARYITLQDLHQDPFDLAVMDVSFISQTLIIPGIVNLLKKDAVLVSLIKPQFEAGRDALNKNGIVKKDTDRYLAVVKVVSCALQNGFTLDGICTSPITGGDGNIEYLCALRLTSTSAQPGTVYIDNLIRKTVFNKA